MTRPTKSGHLFTVGRDGNLEVWRPPSEWKNCLTLPPLPPVTIEHYIAGAGELLDLENTSLGLAMYLRPPKVLELRTDSGKWVSQALCRPLAYVPPGYFFSSRWSQEIEWLSLYFDTGWLVRSELLARVTPHTISPHIDVRDDLLVQIIKGIYEDKIAGMPLGPTYSEALGVAAIHRILALESKRAPREYAHTSLMRRAVEYIRNNFRDRLTLQLVSQAVEYPGDLYSFIRSFKKYSGLSPHQYIIEVRLEAGRDLILYGQCDVTQAALACGFSSPSHFSAAFRKRWGISPTGLRSDLQMAKREEATRSIGH